MADSPYQVRYWNLLYELRVHVTYVHAYAVRYARRESLMNLFMAITSCSSIAGWAIWTEFARIWSVLIAASQVVLAVRPLLPYAKRQKALTDLGVFLQSIFLDMEKNLYYVAEGHLTEEEINSKIAELQSRTHEAVQKCVGDLIIPLNDKLLAYAESDAKQYLKRFTPGG